MSLVGTPSLLTSPRMLVGVGTGLLAFFVAAALLRIYTVPWPVGGVDEAQRLAVAGVAGALGMAVSLLVLAPGTPASPLLFVSLGLAVVALSLTGRLVLRRIAAHPGAKATGSAVPALVFGAGSAGSQLVRGLTAGLSTRYSPVGFIDDNPSKRHLRVDGVPVLGPGSAIARVAAETGARALLIAAPGAAPAARERAIQAGRDAGLHVLVMPELDLILSGQASPFELRRTDPAALLGRTPAASASAEAADAVRGKRVLVTGAGGSIGSELCRQLHRLGVSELIMLDRDESALHEVQMSIYGRALLDSDETVLADIRDRSAVFDVFHKRRPEVAFHAAALKHLPLLERYPDEAWKTNVVGTQNVLDAARSSGVQRLVNISTDKAADPSSVLGASKRITERITADADRQTCADYVSVRFGNVIGSRGSVLVAFEAQIRGGGPVTVTHPDVTRFLMSIPEAVTLVLEAAAIGDRGDVMLLDMGVPVRIADLAERCIAAAGVDVEIVYTGLRPGRRCMRCCLPKAKIHSRRRTRESRASACRALASTSTRPSRRSWSTASMGSPVDLTTCRTASRRTRLPALLPDSPDNSWPFTIPTTSEVFT